jgi:hypothetical protein
MLVTPPAVDRMPTAPAPAVVTPVSLTLVRPPAVVTNPAIWPAMVATEEFVSDAVPPEEESPKGPLKKPYAFWPETESWPP